jgi:galactofuranose transport system permease protein
MPDAPTAAAAPAAPSALRRMTGSSLFWPVVALVALLLVDSLAIPGFLAMRVQDGHLYGILIDILKNGTPTALIALGMTLVIATRGIDLSVGATVAIAGSVACTWIAGADDPTSSSTAVVAIVAALALSLVLGAWNGMLVSLFGIQPIIATLVLMTAGRGLAMLITDGQIITVANPLFAQLGGGFLLGLPVSVVLAAVVFVGVALVTRRTALGMLVESVGVNPVASRLAGVRSRGIVWTVYVFVALCAGLAGLMISSNVTAADANNAGLWIELDAILAVVIGGTLLTGGRGTIVGTVLGVLIFTTLQNVFVQNDLSSSVQAVAKGLIIVVAVLLQQRLAARSNTGSQ